MDQKEITIPEISPNVIESVRFVSQDGKPITQRQYTHSIQGNNIEDNTDDEGFLKEKLFPSGTGKVTLKKLVEDEDSNYEDNPGPFSPLELRNKAEGGEGPIRRGDSRRDLVEKLQKMLKALNYPLGNSGPNQDGVDGDFGSNTEKSVKLFQSAYRDWDDQPLEKDAKVGPRTGDSLNRAMVGIGYDKHETLLELTKEFKLVTIIEKLAVTEGLEI